MSRARSRIALSTISAIPAIAAVIGGLILAAPASAAERELVAKDGGKSFADFERAKPKCERVALLFHQARSNRHEYDPIAPRLRKLGFDTLALDQRSGAERWGHPNKTVAARGGSTGYKEALADLQAALDWAKGQGYKTIVAFGSSYSAALVFELAARNPKALTAIAAFSPGEYFRGEGDFVKGAAAKLSLPVFATCGSQDRENALLDAVLSRCKGKNVRRHRAKVGVHGASTLRADRNSKGAEDNWTALSAFLAAL